MRESGAAALAARGVSCQRESLMTSLRLTLLPVLALLASCTTPSSPDPADQPAPAADTTTNPLLGTWKFDSAASAVHTTAMQANNGTLGRNAEMTQKLTTLSEGSTVTFTDSELTVRVADGRSSSSEYSIQSRDRNGNFTVVDKQGRPATYSISGTKLINPAPDLNYVSVYERQ